MRIYAISGAVVCAAFAASANAQTFLLSEETKMLAHTYLDCVVAESSKLNAAGEPVSETVEMAKTACAESKQAIAIGVMRDVNAELPKSSGKDRIEVAKQLRETVEEQVTAEARLRLARVRSEKANAGNQ